VYFHEVNVESYRTYVLVGMLRGDIRYAPDPEQADYVALQWHREFRDREPETWNAFRDAAAGDRGSTGRVPQVVVYARPGLREDRKVFAMGRWDRILDRKPQELKDYVLDKVADQLVDDLRHFPRGSRMARRQSRSPPTRTSCPGSPSPTGHLPRRLRAGARGDAARSTSSSTASCRSEEYRRLLPDELEQQTAHFITATWSIPRWRSRSMRRESSGAATW